MRRSRILVGLLAVASLMMPTAAFAHDPDEDHPGWYFPSPEGQSPNMHLLASSERTKPLSTYRNSDLAFWGRVAFAGHYEGFRTIDVSDPENPVVLADVACPGAQHDVSVWQDLLFLSVDAPRSKPECDGVATGATPGFEGIRIFDVSDPARPAYVGAVATDCGSHTHTLVPDTAHGRALLYVASYPASAFGTSPFGNSCQRLNPDGTQGHSKISVVEVPLADPERAQVIAEPPFELRDFNNVPGFRGCHDISVFLEINRAASACMTEGQIWDITDPANPKTIARIQNPNVEFWHSSSFTWDGKLVLFGDEAGGGTQPRCRTQDAPTLGAMWFYDLASLDTLDPTVVEPTLGSFKIDRLQGDVANCTTHNFNVVPVKGRYVAVSAYYAGGTSVIDFTDPSRAYEAAFLDPHGANTWSSYWYNGFVFTNDSGRGSDVMLLSDPLRAGARRLPHLNPQTQEQRLG